MKVASMARLSDGQMDHGQVRKPHISWQKPVTWPDTPFGHVRAVMGGQNPLAPLVRQDRQAHWRRTLDKGGQNGDERRETGAKKRLAAASKNATHRRAPQRLAATA